MHCSLSLGGKKSENWKKLTNALGKEKIAIALIPTQLKN
jgi:hypothetical protein